MVGLPRSNRVGYSIRNLSGWLESYCRALEARFGRSFDLRFQDELESCEYSLQLPGLLEKTILEAFIAAEPSSTIEIAAHLTRRGIEIEVIAAGAELVEQSVRAFSRERSLVSHGFSLSSYRARCPDGSIAWIIVQSTAARLRLTA